MLTAEITAVLDRALALGLPAFPCRGDKAPACPHGFRDAVTDPIGLRELWRRHPGPLVGVPTGAASGLDALDIDGPRHPEAEAWLAARLDLLPAGRTHRTRSGGVHLLFHHRTGLRCWSGRPIPGIDGRADGGYIVWWPAADEPLICDAPPVPWPESLLNELVRKQASPPATGESHVILSDQRPNSRYAEGALRCATERVAHSPAGARNTALNGEAYCLGRLIVAGLLDGQLVVDALAAASLAAGLAPREIEATLRSAFSARGLL